MDFISTKVYLVPFQAQDFPTPRPGNQQHMGEGSPLDRLQLQNVPDGLYLFRLKVIYFPALLPWKRGLARRVERHKPLPLGLLKHSRDKSVVLQDVLGRQPAPGSLVLAGLGQRGIEDIQMVGPDVLQLQVTDCRVYPAGKAPI